jgi:hypothetical protein
MIVTLLALSVCAAYHQQPTPAQVSGYADTFMALLENAERSRDSVKPALEKVRAIKPPAGRSVSKNQAAKRARQESDRRNLQARLRTELDAATDAISGLNSSLLPPVQQLIATDTAAVGKVGTLTAPVRIVQVLNGHSVLIAIGEDQTFARLEIDTDGLTDDTALEVHGDWFTVVGTFRYSSIAGMRTVLDIRQLDTAPIKAEIVKRLKNR